MKIELSEQSSEKILRYQISLESVQWGPSCSMRMYRQTDRQTDMTKLIVAFRNFTKAPKIRSRLCRYTVHSLGYLSRYNVYATRCTTEESGFACLPWQEILCPFGMRADRIWCPPTRRVPVTFSDPSR
jgi:hypothetical protein